MMSDNLPNDSSPEMNGRQGSRSKCCQESRELIMNWQPLLHTGMKYFLKRFTQIPTLICELRLLSTPQPVVYFLLACLKYRGRLFFIQFTTCSVVPLVSPYIFKATFISYDSVKIEAIFHLKECSFRNDFTPIVCLFRARASVPQATICSLASPSAMQKNRSLNATIQLLVGTATEITHATRRNLSAEQGCRKRYCPAGPEAYLFEYFTN